MNNVNTVNDLMNRAASALRNKDAAELENLLDVVRDWQQDGDAYDAQENLLGAMLEAVESL